jgi:hypothetical protein
MTWQTARMSLEQLTHQTNAAHRARAPGLRPRSGPLLHRSAIATEVASHQRRHGISIAFGAWLGLIFLSEIRHDPFSLGRCAVSLLRAGLTDGWKTCR